MKGILNVEEAAEYLRHSVHTLNKWRADKKGPKYFKLGKRVVYSQSDLDQWLIELRENFLQTNFNDIQK